jgi:hypothetical protein
MSIRAYVDELDTINKEISANNARNRNLRRRLKEVERNITEYLRAKDQNGLKYNGKAIILERKERRPAKNKKSKQEDLINLLRDLGVADPVEAYDRVLDVQRGDPIEKFNLKVKNLNKF